MNQLPRPEGWGRRISVLVFAVALFGGLGALFAGKTAGEIENTHWMAAVITGAASTSLLLMAVAGTLMLAGHGTLRASFTTTGTTLLPAPVAKWFAMVAISFVVAPVLYMVYSSQLTDDLPALNSKDYFRLPVMVVGGVMMLVVLARRAYSDRRPALKISAEGIDYDDLSTQYTLGWDDIADIVGSLPKRKMFRPVVFERKSGPPLVINNASTYVPGGRALFWLIRYYWLHPDHRSELATGAAIERLSTDRITVD